MNSGSPKSELRAFFLLPARLTAALLIAAPALVIACYSVMTRGPYGGVLPGVAAEAYARVFDPLYGMVLLRTILLSLAATAFCLLAGFPMALFVSRAGRWKHWLLHLVMFPFWTSLLIRTYAWMFLLRDTGPINAGLQTAGLTTAPLPLLYNEGAVLLGLVYSHLPFAVLPMYAALERLDPALQEAAFDLGASRWETLHRVTLPLAAPGIHVAALLVFVPCLGAYLAPDLLGGGKSVMLGNLLQSQFTTARDWPFGAALSVVTMTAVYFLVLPLLRRGASPL